MSMRMGEALSVTLFGESHGPAVGALLEGLPAGTPIDMEALAQDMAARSPGGPAVTASRMVPNQLVTKPSHRCATV